MKRKHKDKTIQYTPNPTNRRVGYTWFACNSCKVKIYPETKLKVHTNTVHASVKKIVPKETPILLHRMLFIIGLQAQTKEPHQRTAGRLICKIPRKKIPKLTLK